MQNLMSRMRAAMEKYNMIEDGDRIAVGVSGGKDSLALLVGLAQMRRFYPKKYEVVGITLDMGFENGGDWSQVKALCEQQTIEYVIKKTELAKVIFEYRKEDNPCSLCAKMRRGSLHDAAKELGCNKLALGHHMDDAAETFMMNLLSGGRIDCFRPVTYLSRKDIFVIRPMVLAREAVVASAAERNRLPVQKSGCPMDGHSEREKMKNLLNELEKDYGHLREKIIGALERGSVAGWNPDSPMNTD